MILYRFVNSNFDSIMKGEFLTRSSDHSNQKLGNGIYFSLTFQDAQNFLASSHRHTYTHILECEIININIDDLFDLRKDPYSVKKSIYANLPINQRNLEFCKSIDKKGIIWSTVDGVSEVCIFSEFIQSNIKILSSNSI